MYKFIGWLIVSMGLFGSNANAASIAVTISNGSLQKGTTAGFNVSSGTVHTLYADTATITGIFLTSSTISNLYGTRNDFSTATLTGTINGSRTDNSTITMTGAINGTRTDNSTATLTGTINGSRADNSTMTLTGAINGSRTDNSTVTMTGTINGTRTDNSTFTATGTQIIKGNIYAVRASSAVFDIGTTSITLSGAVYGSTAVTNSQRRFFVDPSGHVGTSVLITPSTGTAYVGAMTASAASNPGWISINSKTITLTFGSSAIVFLVQLDSGEGVMIVTSYLTSTITILGTPTNVVASATPSASQLGISKATSSFDVLIKSGSSFTTTSSHVAIFGVGSIISSATNWQ